MSKMSMEMKRQLFPEAYAAIDAAKSRQGGRPMSDTFSTGDGQPQMTEERRQQVVQSICTAANSPDSDRPFYFDSGLPVPEQQPSFHDMLPPTPEQTQAALRALEGSGVIADKDGHYGRSLSLAKRPEGAQLAMEPDRAHSLADMLLSTSGAAGCERAGSGSVPVLPKCQ